MANILKKVLHNTSSKSPQDLVSRTSGAADRLTETASERQQEELSKYLTYMKVHCRHTCSQCPLPAASMGTNSNHFLRIHRLGPDQTRNTRASSTQSTQTKGLSHCPTMGNLDLSSDMVLGWNPVLSRGDLLPLWYWVIGGRWGVPGDVRHILSSLCHAVCG